MGLTESGVVQIDNSDCESVPSIASDLHMHARRRNTTPRCDIAKCLAMLRFVRQASVPGLRMHDMPRRAIQPAQVRARVKLNICGGCRRCERSRSRLAHELRLPATSCDMSSWQTVGAQMKKKTGEHETVTTETLAKTIKGYLKHELVFR